MPSFKLKLIILVIRTNAASLLLRLTLCEELLNLATARLLHR